MSARTPFGSSTSSRCLRCSILLRHHGYQQASMATATARTITPAPSLAQMTTSILPIARYPPSQPPSYKPPDQRKSQLLRQYASLLRSTPLMVFFQHNNVKSTEWMGIRRELAKALRKVDDSLNHKNTASSTTTTSIHPTINHDPPSSSSAPLASHLADQIRIQTVQTGIFAVALRIVEFYRPHAHALPTLHPSDPRTASSTTIIPDTTSSPSDPHFTHVLSTAAHSATVSKTHKRRAHPLDPLLAGPLALLTFPHVSPAHLKAALSILAPSPPAFPAPTRRTNPAYYELPVQMGLQKLMLLGARIEGRVMDAEAARDVGLIDGGVDALRAQLVGILQGVGVTVTGLLEGMGRAVYVTVEGRRGMLEAEKGEKQE